MTPKLTRRRVLGAAGAAALGSVVLPPNLRKALADTPARPASKLTDIEHVVILMQENRSFDHYFGTMPGVRGFADPTVGKLPDGRPAFYQPDSAHSDGYLLPFRLDTSKTNAQILSALPHDWDDQHAAWNRGAMDNWIRAKGRRTMGYFTRDDIPFHYALGEAFTVCDNYHCSVIGPTNPNRLYMWSGWIDPHGQYGEPAIRNSMSSANPRLKWTTYPERLTERGISWRIYQEEDNYDDNSLAWFRQFAEAPKSSPLHRNAMVRKSAGWFEYDALHDKLPAVSWLVAPSAQTEHPDWMPAAGAQYIASKVDAIAANPDVWKKTVFILTYDENDGFFDHVFPPIPAAGTADEFVDGTPIGLGFRVPTVIVSPWTAGGYVCSERFDHSSLIRFLEARFGVREPHISEWRRKTVGDLTSAFRFTKPPARFPSENERLRYAATVRHLVAAQKQARDNPDPVVPEGSQTMPGQG
ncbi:alkaline phosphatase family protein [Amycolatopsis anabasis]|uniref:alkaline phosphatase family protein n=1 Tax=Amycolatopsis anabasis TaxID=1840409 RepID=UPI00131B5E2C|nr:alkaline phosphatase family protein [Amycolatopsis anabasis]